MAGQTVQEAFELAFAHQQAGRLREAEALYRQILSSQPRLAEVHNNLGNALKAMGRVDEAMASYRQALAIRADIPQVHNNLGSALHEKGEYEQALSAYRRALLLRPSYPEAHYNLGNTLQKLGRLPEAIASYREAISLWPNYAEAHYNLGSALGASGRREEAIAAYRHAVWLRPNYPDAWNNLANELKAAGRLGESVAAYKQAIVQRPGFADAYNNLGNVQCEAGQAHEAIASYRQAISLRPDYAEAHYNLANAFASGERFDEAIDTYRRAISLRSDYAEAYHNLASALKDTGRVQEAIAVFERALTLKGDPLFASSLLYSLHFHPDYDAGRIWQAHAEWNQRFARPLAPAKLDYPNDPTPDRRLRVGYVSPDFREHPVGRFLLPLLANHDRAKFEVFCYTDVRHADRLTEVLRSHVDVWRSTIELSDERLAELIRQDRIDILVDLTMHMRGTRLLAFARKPAPVQMTYLAYCSTTGLETMDYRLTDPYLDPSDGDESVYSEKSVRLPQSYWCYQPSSDWPEPGPPPAVASGQVTFGSLNNYSKVSDDTLSIWCKLLRLVPNSKLMIYAPEGSPRLRARDLLARKGVIPQRLEFVGLTLPLERYLQQYQRIDIALDPFPYPGGTTSCDALWMGVPVVSLAGDTAVSRAGLSILSNIGLPELVAQSTRRYLRIAVHLANDLPRLSSLRSTLRQRMKDSPLMDAPRFARNVQAAFRKLWVNWCDSRGAADSG